MTRRELIEKAAAECAQIKITNKNLAHLAFIEIVQWADKTTINRGYQWILNNMSWYIKVNGFEICINNKDMASDFRKAMLEEE